VVQIVGETFVLFLEGGLILGQVLDLHVLGGVLALQQHDLFLKQFDLLIVNTDALVEVLFVECREELLLIHAFYYTRHAVVRHMS